MSVKAKITAYNYDSSSQSGCSDFSLNTYWGNNYKNVFYVCGDLGRPQFNDIIETETNSTGQSERTQNTSIEIHSISVLAISPLLAFLKTIDKHDVKTIEFLDTGDIYTIQNIDIEDTGEELTPTNLVYIRFEDEPISKVSDNVFVLSDLKQAFWDNDNNGVKDINGGAQFTGNSTEIFNTWQLYYESDGTTPATSGDVLILAYAISQTGLDSLVGVFRGEFGDLFSDSSKWQSTQQIWDYFNLADNVGHTKRVQFDKRAYAEDNGYFSDETEDRAVDIRFELSIDGSTPQLTTLILVYSILGGFSYWGVSGTTYGVTTIGKPNEKNTLSTFQDVRTPLAGGASTLISSSVLSTVTAFSNKYIFDAAPSGEQSYDGIMITSGGFSVSNFRGAYGVDNFHFSLSEITPINQSINILNYTLGINPLSFSFFWKFQRFPSGHGFPNLGDVVGGGSAEVLLDGVLVNNIPSIVPGVSIALFGLQSILLSDTQKHTVLLRVPTNQGYEIYTEFEVQIKALF